MIHKTAEKQEPDSFSNVGYNISIREMIWHENQLITSRIGWFTTTQALFLTGYALSDKNSLALLELTIPIIACMVCLLAFIAIKSGQNAISVLQNDWSERIVPNKDSFPRIIGYSHQTEFMRQCTPVLVLPLVFLTGWVCMISVEIVGQKYQCGFRKSASLLNNDGGNTVLQVTSLEILAGNQEMDSLGGN